MKQRVTIAIALLGNPSLLLSDEPGTALDVTVYRAIRELFKEKIKQRDLSLIYVTHNLAVAREIAEKIYVMYAGTIVESGKQDTILRNPRHPYTFGLIKSIPKLVGGFATGIKGRIPSYYEPPEGCRFHPRCPHAMPICKRERPKLRKVNGDHKVACHL